MNNEQTTNEQTTVEVRANQPQLKLKWDWAGLGWAGLGWAGLG